MENSQANNTSLYTFTGYLGLLIWAFTALIVSKISNLPTFQTLAIGMALSFLLCTIKFTIRRKWHTLNLRSTDWIIPGLCFSGNLIFYTLAFKFAPADQADLIVYLWPSLVIVLSRFFLPQEGIRFNHILAVLIGVAGISVLVLPHVMSSDVPMDGRHVIGYVFAFLCALCWSSYTILCRRKREMSPHMVGIYCGLGAPIALILHFFIETPVMPDSSQLLCLLVYGILVMGLAYSFWDIGVKRGNFKLLAVLSYGNPVISILLLVLFGSVQFTSELGFASVLVAVSAVVARG